MLTRDKNEWAKMDHVVIS